MNDSERGYIESVASDPHMRLLGLLSVVGFTIDYVAGVDSVGDVLHETPIGVVPWTPGMTLFYLALFIIVVQLARGDQLEWLAR